jgi:hypothetical protein
MNDLALIAAVDQAHAEAEQTLTTLIGWWGETRKKASLGKADEVAVLTFMLGSETDYSALLATAVIRLLKDEDE